MKLGTLCYIENNDKILLLHRIKKENDMHEGKWVGVGGKLEQGETPEECVIRETQEETGLNILEPKLKGIITFPKFSNDEDWYVYLFTSDKYEGTLIECDEGELKWIDKSEIFNLPSWDGDKIFIKWILEDKSFFSAKFIYEKQELIDYNVIFY